MVILIETPRRLYICARCLQDDGIKVRNACDPEMNLNCGRCGQALNYNMDSTFLQAGQFTVEDEVQQAPVLHLAGGSTIALQQHEVNIPLITKAYWEHFSKASTENMRDWLRRVDPRKARQIMAVLYVLRAHLDIDPADLPPWDK